MNQNRERSRRIGKQDEAERKGERRRTENEGITDEGEVRDRSCERNLRQIENQEMMQRPRRGDIY